MTRFSGKGLGDNLINVHSAVYLYHLAAEAVGDIKTLFRGKLVDILFKQVVLEVDLLYQQLGVKNIGLIYIDIDGIILGKGRFIDIILNGSDIVVDEELFAQHITGESADAVVDGDDIGIEAGYQIIQGIKGRYSTAGRYVYIHAESGDRVIGVILGEGVHGHMALIQMSVYHFGSIGENAQIAGGIDRILIQLLFGYEDIHGSALGFIILFGNIKHAGTDHLGNVAKYFCKTFGVILLVDILDIILLFFLTFSVANIVDIKTEGLGKIIEAVKGDLIILQSAIYPFGVFKASRVNRRVCGG